MITNIIKNIIKEFPQVANSPIIKVCENSEQHVLTIAPADYDNLMIVVTAKTSVPTSAEEWKRNAIAEHIYMATQSDVCNKDNKVVTMADLAEIIDNIINSNVVLWQL